MSADHRAYWNKNIPWTFLDVENRPSFAERRRRRYMLQDYMDIIKFHQYKGKKVLEVGCGSGIDSVEFARFGAEVTCVDASPLAIRETERSFDEAKEFFSLKDADIINAQAEDLPFGDSEFDLVYSFGVLHHLPQPELAVREFARVTKDYGEVIAMLYHKDSLLYAYSIEHLGLSFERVPDAPFTRAYTVEEAHDLFFPHFSKIDISIHYNVIDLPNQRKVKLNIPDELGLGWHMIVRARK